MTSITVNKHGNSDGNTDAIASPDSYRDRNDGVCGFCLYQFGLLRKIVILTKEDPSDSERAKQCH